MQKGTWEGRNMIPCYFTLEELRLMYSWLRRIGENKHVNSLDDILENLRGKIANEEPKQAVHFERSG